METIAGLPLKKKTFSIRSIAPSRAFANQEHTVQKDPQSPKRAHKGNTARLTASQALLETVRQGTSVQKVSQVFDSVGHSCAL